jgi:hypothetical protein
MERDLDLSAFDWIDRALLRDDGLRTVAKLLPRGFEAYCKVFHPITSSHEFVTESTAPLEPLEEHRVRWRDLATAHGFEFHPWFSQTTFAANGMPWPLHFVPAEGSIPYRYVERLARYLASDQPHLFLYEIPTSFALFADYPEVSTGDVLLRGTLNELASFVLQDEYGDPPSYWWPQDHSWCVVCDFDLPFTIVGATRDRVEAICDDDLMEVVEIDIDDDFMRDLVNLHETDRL